MTPEFRFSIIYKDLIQLAEKERYPYFELSFTETSGYGHHLKLAIELGRDHLEEIKKQIEKLLTEPRHG
jgi:hypothetical protein